MEFQRPQQLPAPKESDVQKSILQYLQMRGYFVWRNNTGGFGGEASNGKKWWVRAGFKGSGDIIGMTKEGKFLSIEVKCRKGTTTPDQDRFIERVCENGGVSFVAKDLQDVLDRGL